MCHYFMYCVVCGVNLVVNICALAFLSWFDGATVERRDRRRCTCLRPACPARVCGGPASPRVGLWRVGGGDTGKA